MNSRAVREWMDAQRPKVRAEQLAVMLGVSHGTIRTILRGKNPLTPTIKLLAVITGIPEYELLGESVGLDKRKAV